MIELLINPVVYAIFKMHDHGVNNIVPFSILSPNFASAIGFTDENVRKILEDAGIMDRYEEVAEWYDG